MIIIKCQKCGGPIAKGFEELASIPYPVSFTFAARCPACKTDVEIQIRSKAIVAVFVDRREQVSKTEQEDVKIRTL